MSERDQVPFTWEPYGVNYRIIDGGDHELPGVHISGYYEVRLIEYIEKLETDNARLREEAKADNIRRANGYLIDVVNCCVEELERLTKVYEAAVSAMPFYELLEKYDPGNLTTYETAIVDAVKEALSDE